jgi:hypothetical protein
MPLLDVSNADNYGIISLNLLLEEFTGSSNPAYSRAFFIPEGGRLLQIRTHIFPPATTSIKFESSQNMVNIGPNANDKWYPLNTGSGQLTEDMAQKEIRLLNRDEYSVVNGWIRLVTGAVAANSRFWVELKARVPYRRHGWSGPVPLDPDLLPYEPIG